MEGVTCVLARAVNSIKPNQIQEPFKNVDENKTRTEFWAQILPTKYYKHVLYQRHS